MSLKNEVQLITYPNRLGGDLKELNDFCSRKLSRAIGGMHILPIYPSNADGGFSPLTHKEVDPAYGTWTDVERIANKFDLCLDLALNHISDESKEFLDYVERGKKSQYRDLFLDTADLGPITEEDLAKIHIRKEKEPMREVVFKDGTKTQVWCTFTEHQIDLNYQSPLTFGLMQEYLEFLMDRGVKLFRLDAFGYVTVRIGTNCFLVEPEIYDILNFFKDTTAARGAHVLPEVHHHFSYQNAIAARGMYAYGFALPVLTLHALLAKNTYYLKDWLRICPSNQVTVLDTHDGICIPDVEGLLPKPEIEKVIENVSARSGDPVLVGSAAHVGSVGAIYQLTCTFRDALKRNDGAHLAARAIQMFTPGIPQVYYVGLLNGENDNELVEKTGEKRDINRHYYSLAEAEAALQRPGPELIIKLMTFRSCYPAFDGQFNMHYSSDSSLHLSWVKGVFRASLFVDTKDGQVVVSYKDIISSEDVELFNVRF